MLYSFSSVMKYSAIDYPDFSLQSPNESYMSEEETYTDDYTSDSEDSGSDSEDPTFLFDPILVDENTSVIFSFRLK